MNCNITVLGDFGRNFYGSIESFWSDYDSLSKSRCFEFYITYFPNEKHKFDYITYSVIDCKHLLNALTLYDLLF